MYWDKLKSGGFGCYHNRGGQRDRKYNNHPSVPPFYARFLSKKMY